MPYGIKAKKINFSRQLPVSALIQELTNYLPAEKEDANYVLTRLGDEILGSSLLLGEFFPDDQDVHLSLCLASEV
jgi:hypothetical protein